MEKINPETIRFAWRKQHIWDWIFNGECYAIPYGETSLFKLITKARSNCASGTAKIRLKTFCESSTAGRFLHGRGGRRQTECAVQTEAVFQ